MIGELRLLGRGSTFDRTTMNRVIAWYSRHTGIVTRPQKCRVAFSPSIYRAYISPLGVSRRYGYDCGGISIRAPVRTPDIPPGIPLNFIHIYEQAREQEGFTGFIYLTKESFIDGILAI